jgi:uncharacterized protein (TIGR03086 family)
VSATEDSSDAPRADLAPIAAQVSGVVRAVGHDDLSRPTPCPDSSVATMLDHLAGLTVAFMAVARHEPVPGGDQPPVPDAARLDPEFRDTLPRRLEALGEAWGCAVAWTGATRVGGVDLPREVAGLVALDELVVHGWDLAVAIGHPYQPEAAAVEGALGFVGPTAAERPEGTPGLFGPPVAVPSDASPLDRLLGLTGRDPRWSRP